MHSKSAGGNTHHPYSFYNSDGNADTIEEYIDGTYYAVHNDDDDLIGFYCFGENAQVPGGRKSGLYQGGNTLDIGLGMRPDLTGKGAGQPFVKKGIEFARQNFQPETLRLSVATFNKRAISVYEKEGFIHDATFLNNGTEFLIMTLPLQKSL